MGNEYTGADMLRAYHTGAGALDAAQSDALTSLGGYLSSSRVKSLEFRRLTAVAGLRIDHVAGLNGPGIGNLRVLDEDEIAWTPPGGVTGTTVTIANGETKACFGGAGHLDKFVIVTRTSANALTGSETLQLIDAYRTVCGGSDFTSAEALAGEYKWLAPGVKNHDASAVTDIKVWLDPVGTKAASPTGSLGATGAGTITKVGAFADWPTFGLCEIRQSNETLREIVFYSSRTDDALTVESGGRAQLGTSAGAGAGTDILRAIPYARVAIETPSSDQIQTITSETTDPTGLTLVTGTENTIATTHASLAASAWIGVHVNRLTLPATYADARVRLVVNYSWVSGGTTYTGQLRGLYRIANDALKLDEFYVKANADPDPAVDAAVDTDVYDAALTMGAVAAGATYHCIRLRRNEWNILEGIDPDKIDRIRVGSGGAEEDEAPTGADNVTVYQAADGAIQVIAAYFPVREGTTETARLAKRATHWLVYHTTDGTDPNLAVPTEVAMATDSDIGEEILDWTSAAALDGTTHKVRIATRREGTPDVDSTLSAIYSVTASTLGPTRPRGAVFFGQAAAQHQAGQAVDTDPVYIDQANNIYWVGDAKGISLYADAALIWRWVWEPTAYLYIPNTWTLDMTTAIAGSGTGAVDVISWTAGDKRLGINVGGTRVAVIDVTNSIVYAANVDTTAVGNTSTAQIPAFARAAETLFQAWKPSTEQMETYGQIAAAGILTLAGEIDNSLAQAAIEAL